jgi:hypothetical protein
MTIQDDSEHAAEASLGEAPALEASGIAQNAINEGEAALKGMQAGSREMLGWAHDAYQVNVKAWRALAGCRTAPEAMAVHGRLMQDHLKLLMDNAGRMTMATWKTAIKAHDAHGSPIV